MRRFVLVRDVDVSGVSGIGMVAEGVRFTDGKVTIRWFGNSCSTVIWDRIEDAVAIHGHEGKTRLVWVEEAATEIKLSDFMAGMTEAEIKLSDFMAGMTEAERNRLMFGNWIPEPPPPDEKKHMPRDLKSVIYRSVFEPSTVPESEQAMDHDAVRHSKIMRMALRHIAHYLDNGPAMYDSHAFIKAMHYLSNVAKEALREIGDE